MASFALQKKDLLIVAEIGLAHRGSLAHAIELVDAARECGATAVKFQIYTPAAIWKMRSDIEKREKLQLGLRAYEKILEHSTARGLIVGASLFSDYGFNLAPMLDFLKIASRTFPMVLSGAVGGIRRIMDSGKQVIISCGYALPSKPQPEICYMACDSTYPSRRPFEGAQVEYLKSCCDLWGYSSHLEVPATHDVRRAVLAGANVIEKHFCMSRREIEIDRDVSMEPDEFKIMVRELRESEAAR